MHVQERYWISYIFAEDKKFLNKEKKGIGNSEYDKNYINY